VCVRWAGAVGGCGGGGGGREARARQLPPDTCCRSRLA
jgi:hypothetical protein